MIPVTTRIGTLGILFLGAATAVADLAFGLQTRPFKGRVVVVGAGPPPARIKVRLGELGTTETNDGGFFAYAVPIGVRSFSLQIETGNPRWVLRYPLGPIPIPADTSFVTDVIVGPSIEHTLARAYASENAQIRKHLEEAGIRDSLVMATLKGLLREFADRTQLEAETLMVADQRELARAREFPRIAAALEDYLIKLHNVEIAFRIILQFAFTNDSAFAELKTSIRRYNEAFEVLKQGRTGFEQSVAEYWGSERLVGELRNVLDYALGEIHEIHVLPLNDVLPDITAVSKRQVRGQLAEQKREQVIRRVTETLRALQPRIQELDRRKNRLLNELQAL